MKIGFFNGREDANEIEAAGRVLETIAGANFRTLPNRLDELFYESGEFRVCVFHRFPEGWSEEQLHTQGEWGKSDGVIICSISTAPLGKEFRPIVCGRTWHWIVAVPNTRSVGLIGLAEARLKENWSQFLDALQERLICGFDPDAEGLGNDLSRFLNPDQTDPLHALHLLCEAWIYTGGGKTIHVADGGFAVHAPLCSDDWFAPFDPKWATTDWKEVADCKGEGSTDAEEKRNAARVLAAQIAEEMGSAKSAVLNFLEKLADLLPTGDVKEPTPLDPATFGPVISTLEETLRVSIEKM